jgi:hypothetical protein
MSALKELYGVGILFFYYLKFPLVIGLPILYFGLDYDDNIIMDILWVYSFGLIIKDIIYKFVLKRSYCEECKTSAPKNRDN